MAVKKGAKKKQKKRVSKLKGEEQAPELPAIEDTPPRTVPGWVTTFADLMSLLMVFFVMLVSVSTIEKTTFEKMVKSMKSELGGGQTKDDVETVEVTDSVETVEEVGEATEKVVEELKEELKVEIKKKILEVEGGKDAVTIQLLQNATFAQVASSSNPASRGSQSHWSNRSRNQMAWSPSWDTPTTSRFAADFTGPTGSSPHHARSRWSRL